MLKYVLFWLYLWQLKDYHIGRFADHFRTQKGKQLIFNYFQIIKLILFVSFIISGSIYNLYFFLFVYGLQALIFLKGVITKSVKIPVITLKTLFLIFVSLLVVVGAGYLGIFKLNGLFGLKLIVAFDILTPIIISAVVLLIQPFFVFLRNITLRKAKEKMEKIKSLSGVKVIAITGSYGKTSTKEFLYAILSKKFKVLKTKEHQNSEIGVAKCILEDLKPSHEIFIAEVGAYDKGKVREVCFVLKPKIGIVTGVNEQHLALFGSLNNLLSAEGGGELADILPNNGTLFVNGDNKYCLDLYKKTTKPKKTYSLSNKIINADIWAEDVEIGKDYVSFVAVNKEKELFPFKVNVLGRQSVQNLLGAILVAKNLGMTFEEISEGCKNILQEHSGMVLKQGKHNINIIDSSYSSNPDGVIADLDYFKVFQGKKVIVMPCLIELGEKSSQIHEKIGEKIGEICDLAIITNKDKFAEIERGFNKTKRETGKCILIENSQDIYSLVTIFCKSGDAVLLEGRVPAELINLLFV
ncbi:MAG: UDP-N-acetylmuramoyl-tripeptide--D-alanyl-D-alanine ligase [Candidatus Staskawiczbacteria bacterium]|nr:UDP-N-acetylmuramoyl-tripeptide--D-alanyl-D-alanine ligase [Candidatus Staskawiczbacteria bacterium]